MFIRQRESRFLRLEGLESPAVAAVSGVRPAPRGGSAAARVGPTRNPRSLASSAPN